MIEPLSGELNSRVVFQTVETVVNEASGFTNKVKKQFEVWGKLEAVGTLTFWNTAQIGDGITHRIFVRSVKNKTFPSDFRNVCWAVCDGFKYRIVRVMNANSAYRFTVLEVKAEGVVS